MNTAPLQGIKVIDMTQVQSGPSCTQMLAWFGAEVIKIERPGKGDATRNELQDIPGQPSLYFLQLNSGKKSLTLDAATPDGKEILTRLIKSADVFVENMHPGAAEKLGFGWDAVHAMNPKVIYATLKGFPAASDYAHLKAYEPIAQCTGGAASTTGWYTGEYNIPTQSGAALGDSNTGMHLLIGILAALLQRQKTGEGVMVYQSMQEACLNLCRIKLRDQLILDRLGYCTQFPQYPDQKFPKALPRSGNTEGGGVLGWCYKCKNWANDDNDYVYVIVERGQKQFENFCKVIGFDDWLTDPKFSTPDARDKNKPAIWARIQEFCIDKTKEEVTQLLGTKGIPCAPVLSMLEIENDPSLRAAKAIVEIDQGGERGKFLTVGCPCTFSNFEPQYTPCPTLGGNNDEVLKSLGYTDEQIAAFAKNGTTEPLADGAM
ncbi:MAG: formyl-CoA transferase [Muribaculaceae bacterium]|nr:formyl-CoA transferase [Muribaculaceae bacterium]